MAGQNPWRTSASNNHSVDVILAVFTQNVCANNTGELRDVNKGDGTNNHPDERLGVGWVPKHHDGNRCQRDSWDGHDDVHDAHDELIHALARNGSDGTQNDSNSERNTGRSQTNQQRVAAAVEQAR